MHLQKLKSKIRLFVQNRIVRPMKRNIVKMKSWVQYQTLIAFNKHIKSQIKNPSSIPIIIINFNQLYYLQKLVSFLIERNFKNIIIVDNKSDFPPLLDYYKQIKNHVTIEYMDDNYGHKVFFRNKQLQQKYGQGYYVITDADIVPNENLPADFMSHMIKLLNSNMSKITKVGFALKIDDIPDHFPLKQKVMDWEKQFWQHEVAPGIYDAIVDTTFAIYKPFYPSKFSHLHMLGAFRMAGNYTARHGGWYVNPKIPTEEYLHYNKTSHGSNSWKMDEAGGLVGSHKDVY